MRTSSDDPELTRIHGHHATPGGNALTAVVIPMIPRELSQVEFLFFLWGLWRLVGRAQGQAGPLDVRLILTFDVEPRTELEETVAEAYDFYGLGTVFSECTVRFCAIPPEENIYIRTGQQPPAQIPPLGLKSGPNTQFFRSMAPLCDSEQTVLLNEVDCFPVRWDWLRRLQRLVAGSEPFWILGSPYRGWGRLGPELLQHVNGNALYGVGTAGFKQFLLNWEAALKEEVKRNPDLAYDIFHAYRHAPLFDPLRWGGAPLDLFKSLQEMLCRIRFSPSIHNLAGDEEISGKRRVDLRSYLADHPELVLVHGRFLKLQILQEALDAVRHGRDRATPALPAEVGDYLLEGARRLLDKDNLDASRAIMALFRAPAAESTDHDMEV